MGWLALLMARRQAGTFLGNLAESAAKGNLSMTAWRNLVAHAAQKGDLDALFAVYVNPTRSRLKNYVESGEKRENALD